jgi:hypothetical protein
METSSLLVQSHRHVLDFLFVRSYTHPFHHSVSNADNMLLFNSNWMHYMLYLFIENFQERNKYIVHPVGIE